MSRQYSATFGSISPVRLSNNGWKYPSLPSGPYTADQMSSCSPDRPFVPLTSSKWLRCSEVCRTWPFVSRLLIVGTLRHSEGCLKNAFASL